MDDRTIKAMIDSVAEKMDQRVKGHERLCDERWGEAKKALDRIELAVSIQGNRQWLAVAGVISALIGLVGFLASRVFQ